MARKMKDSGIEWIGQIPSDWKTARLKDIKSSERYAIVDGPFGTAISTKDYVEEGIPLVRIVNLGNPNIIADNLMHITEEHAESIQRSQFGIGDIIFAKTGATIGKCAINDSIEYGILSSSCVKIKIANAYCNKYYYYLFFTKQFNDALKLACVGTTRDTINLNPFSCLQCIIPPYAEQKRIADFLDEECARIDEVIEKTQVSIEEYKKLKQSIITEAVTKGIRKNRPMKDSGIEWIGEMPEEWRKAQLKRFVKVNNGKEIAIEVDKGAETAVPVYGSGGIFKYTNESMYSGTAVMFGRKGTLGKPLYVNDTFWAVDTMYYLTFSTEMDAKYGYYSLTAFDWQPHITQTALPSVVASEIVACGFAIPPLNEQHEIVKYLDLECSRINQILKEKEKLLSELWNYKKSLIYEYVTGKKEVG